MVATDIDPTFHGQGRAEDKGSDDNDDSAHGNLIEKKEPLLKERRLAKGLVFRIYLLRGCNATLRIVRESEPGVFQPPTEVIAAAGFDR